MHMSPAYSPFAPGTRNKTGNSDQAQCHTDRNAQNNAPELGCVDTAANPVIEASQVFKELIILWYPGTCSCGVNGWMFANSGQVTGIISEAAFNFIVHEPEGFDTTQCWWEMRQPGTMRHTKSYRVISFHSSATNPSFPNDSSISSFRFRCDEC